MTRSRYPTLQVPTSVAPDLRQFLEGVKERLEITTGDRGDPRDRLLTVRDVEAAGMATVTVRNKFATLSGGTSAVAVDQLLASSGTAGTFDDLSAPTLDSLKPEQLNTEHDFVLYNNNVSRVQRIGYGALSQLFLTSDSDVEADGNWTFINEELPLEIRTEAPRLRLTETAEFGETLDTDNNVWDWLLDAGLLQLNLVSDDEATSVALLEMGRDGMAPQFLALMNGTVLQIQDGTLAEPGLVFDGEITSGLSRPTTNVVAVSVAGVERLRANTSGIAVTGTAVLTAVTGHLDLTPSAAATFAALKLRNNAGTEIWRLNSEVDGDLDFSRQSGAGVLRVNTVSVNDATLFTSGTLDDLRLSANVPLKNTANTFALTNTFTLTPVVPDTSWTYAKIQDVSATSRVLGRASALAGVIEELTGAQVATIVGYTAADVLAKLLTVDGTGSLLDTDLLDGVQGADYGRISVANIWDANQTITSANPRLLFLETGLTADTGAWDFNFDDGAFDLRTRTDADGTGFPVLRVLRPAGSTTPQRIYIGEITTDPAGVSTSTSSGANFAVLISRTNNNATGGVRTGIVFDTSAGAGYNTVKYETSVTSPTQIANGSVLGQNVFAGYNLDTGLIVNASAFRGVASEAWTTTAQGTRLEIFTTPAGTTTVIAGFRVQGNAAQVVDGTVTAPSWSWISDTDCGLYRISTNRLGVACNATKVLDIASTLFDAIATTVRLTGTSGGTVTVASGAGVTSAGGAITLTAGAGGATSGTGGAVLVNSGVSTDGNSGAITLTTPDALGTNRRGGTITLDAGNSTGNGQGGSFAATGGLGGPTGDGGSISLTGGSGGSTSGTGGAVILNAGAGIAGQGGAFQLSAGASGGTAPGASINIAAGSAAGTNQAGGLVRLVVGAATGTGAPGCVTISPTPVNALNDAAAATAQIPVGGIYRNGSVLMVRVA